MPDIEKPMKFDVMWCPECGGDPIGTVETVEALAKLDVKGEGFVHSGYTDIWWDTQKTQEDDEGRMRVACANNHDWYVNIITEEEDSAHDH